MLAAEKVKSFRAAQRAFGRKPPLACFRSICGALSSRRYARLNLDMIFLP